MIDKESSVARVPSSKAINENGTDMDVDEEL